MEERLIDAEDISAAKSVALVAESVTAKAIRAIRGAVASVAANAVAEKAVSVSAEDRSDICPPLFPTQPFRMKQVY